MKNYKGAYLIHSDQTLEQGESYPCWDVLTQQEFNNYEMEFCSWTYVDTYDEYIDCDTSLINDEQHQKLISIIGDE